MYTANRYRLPHPFENLDLSHLDPLDTPNNITRYHTRAENLYDHIRISHYTLIETIKSDIKTGGTNTLEYCEDLYRLDKYAYRFVEAYNERGDYEKIFLEYIAVYPETDYTL